MAKLIIDIYLLKINNVKNKPTAFYNMQKVSGLNVPKMFPYSHGGDNV